MSSRFLPFLTPRLTLLFLIVTSVVSCASAPVEETTLVTGVRVQMDNLLKTRISRGQLAHGPAINIQVIDYDGRPGKEAVIIGFSEISVFSLDTGLLIDRLPYPASARPDLFPVMVKASNGRDWLLTSTGKIGQEGGLLDLNGAWRWRLTDMIPPIKSKGGSKVTMSASGQREMTRWESAETPITRVYKITPVDLEGDGVSEFLVHHIDIHCVAEDGTLLWTKKKDDPGVSTDTAVYREPGSEKDLALHIYSVNMRKRKELKALFFDYGGNLVRQVDLPHLYKVSDIINWRGKMAYFGKAHRQRNRKFGIIGFDGEILFQYEENEDVRPVHIVEARGAPVRLAKDSPPYLAVVARFHRKASRSIFYIFSPEGKLVHKEVIRTTAGLAVASNNNNGTEVILVSDGAGVLWSYSLDQKLSGQSPTHARK